MKALISNCFFAGHLIGLGLSMVGVWAYRHAGHPEGRSVINYDLLILCMPIAWIGCMCGVALNLLLPREPLLLVMMLLLVYSAHTMIKKAFLLYEQEETGIVQRTFTPNQSVAPGSSSSKFKIIAMIVICMFHFGCLFISGKRGLVFGNGMTMSRQVILLDMAVLFVVGLLWRRTLLMTKSNVFTASNSAVVMFWFFLVGLSGSLAGIGNAFRSFILLQFGLIPVEV